MDGNWKQVEISTCFLFLTFIKDLQKKTLHEWHFKSY